MALSLLSTLVLTQNSITMLYIVWRPIIFLQDIDHNDRCNQIERLQLDDIDRCNQIEGFQQGLMYRPKRYETGSMYQSTS